MAGIYQSVTELIGRTPLLEVKNLEKELNLQARVLVKLEYFNPVSYTHLTLPTTSRV